MKIGLLNIGNTRSEICSYDLSGRRKVLTENLLDDSASFLSGFTDVYTASVVAETIEALKRQYENIRFHELTVDKISSVDFSKVDASSLGADRLANIIAAKSFYRGSVLVVDCGTCVTAELLFDEDFLGGLIMPGRSLQRKALNLFTSKLPEVEFSDTLFEIGKNTQEAILIGTDNVSLYGLHKWIEFVLESYYEVRVCFTGGDFEFYTKNATFSFSKKPNLTLEGLRVFADGNC